MAEPEKQTISRELAEAFAQAVAMYDSWTPQTPEERLPISGQLYTIADVCRLLQAFGDPLPEDVLRDLLSYMDESYADLRVRLAADRSYATGARCLLKLMKGRAAQYREKEARLRGS